MNKIVLIALILALAVSNSCMDKEYITPAYQYPEIEEDGGTTNRTDPNAPKVIESTEITSFTCIFSTLDLAEETELGNCKYMLEASVKDKIVIGKYTRYGETEDRNFETDSYFMIELQKIVAKYNFAKHNGLSVTVHGLPDMYGAELHIMYASGETIYASDNQSCFLSFEAMEDLVNLFSKQ